LCLLFIRLGIADTLRAIAAAGGAHLWTVGLSSYELARHACLTGLHDSSAAVRAAYARAIGELVTSAGSEEAKASVELAGPKVKHHLAQEKALAAVPDQCLSFPFAEAAANSDLVACTALAQAWVWHLNAARVACGVDEAAFLESALKPLEALAAACAQAGTTLESGPSCGDYELGAGISGGERPHAQACVLYILRAGVVEQLGEVGQRLLLNKLAVVLQATESPAAAHTAVGVVALELLALLAEVLGEVGPECCSELESAIAAKLVGPHAPLRVQAASALAALAVAEPGNAARLLGSALGNLKSAADALVEAALPGPDKSKPLNPGTPRGPGAGKLKAEMNSLHGWALGAAALVAASARLPLGVPSHYMHVAVQLASALIEAPRTRFPAATCLEREAGYIMLGAVCHVACPLVLSMYGDTVLSLWAPALGPDGAAALDALFKSKEVSGVATFSCCFAF